MIGLSAPISDTIARLLHFFSLVVSCIRYILLNGTYENRWQQAPISSIGLFSLTWNHDSSISYFLGLVELLALVKEMIELDKISPLIDNQNVTPHSSTLFDTSCLFIPLHEIVT